MTSHGSCGTLSCFTRGVTLALLCCALIAAGDDKTSCAQGGAKIVKSKVGKGECFGFATDTPGSGCDGVGNPVKGESTLKELTLRAIHYVPRPVGVPSDTDVYTPKYNLLHKRDLKQIKKMKANAIRLDPWDIHEDHSDFLQLAQETGLFVIPTFDFKQYADPDYHASDEDIRDSLWSDFRTFMRSANQTQDGFEKSPILAWSINYAFPVNESVPLDQQSLGQEGPKLKNYFGRLCMLRAVHWQFEWDKKAQIYKRPLAVPVDVNSAKYLAQIGWYLGFAETEWGSWPDCRFWQEGPSSYGEDKGRLRQLGSFDIWIAQGMALSSPDNQMNLMNHTNQFNGTMVTGKFFTYQWPDPTKRTATDARGPTLTGCDEGCTYTTRKAVIAQFGFSALILEMDTESLHKYQTDADNQQETILQHWTGLTGKEATSCAVASGGIVDEWMDDWDRNSQVNCLSDPYHHALSDSCATFSSGASYPEWLGLNAQYSFFTLQCTSPRVTSQGKTFFSFDSDKLTSWDAEGTFSQCVSLAVEFPFPFRGGLKQFRMIIPNWAAGILLLLLVAFFRFIGRFSKWIQKLCGCQRRAPRPPLEVPLQNAQTNGVALRRTDASSNSLVASDDSSLDDGQEDDDFVGTVTAFSTTNHHHRDRSAILNSHSSYSSEADGTPAATLVANHNGSVEPLIDLEIPAPFAREPSSGSSATLGSQGSNSDLSTRNGASSITPPTNGTASNSSAATARPQPPKSFRVKIACDAEGKMTPVRARLFLVAHSNVQKRRLMQQIESELLALQARDGYVSSAPARTNSNSTAVAKEDWGKDRLLIKALENVHARTMEGYLAWLEFHAWPLSPENKLLSMMKGQRPPYQLFMDALLLRLLESLSEHIIHAPEYICMTFHRVRYPTRVAVPPKEGEPWTFDIDMKALQQGIDMMNAKPNPYHGGINFDDINDCGLYNRQKISKTFKEAPSLLVIVDVLSNFSPVFTVKMWVFMAAWLTNHVVTPNTAETSLDSWTITKNCLTQLMTTDSIILMVVELLTFSLGMYQKRCRWRFGYTRWMVRRGVYLVTAALGIFCTFFSKLSPLSDQEKAWVPFIYWLWRLTSFKALTLKHRTPFISGVPNFRGLLKGRKQPMAKARWFIWLSMLACCYIFECFLVVPLASGFQYGDFCLQACSLNEHHDALKLMSSTCLACSGTLGFIWLIVALTAFFDIYYIFYFGTAVVGYCMGVNRGLNNILSTAQRHADLSSDSDAYAKVGGVGRPTSENSDGNTMREVFGSNWRMVWSRLVESYVEECIISEEDADKIVNAAGTVRYKSAEAHYDEMVLPTDVFSKLHFVPHSGRNGTGNSFSFSPRGAHSSTFGASFRVPQSSFGSSLPDTVDMTGKTWISALHVRTQQGDRLRDFHLVDEPGQDAFTVELTPPQPVHEVFFTTSDKEDAFDPTAWALKGETPDGKIKYLIIQRESQQMRNGYRLPRSAKVGPFVVEPWRLKSEHPSDLRLDRLPAAAAERLSFFTVTLQALRKDRIEPNERLMDSHIGTIPSLTQIIPCYNETVINSEKSLLEEDGVQSNLAFIISQYPGEWENLAAQHQMTAKDLFKSFSERRLSPELVMEVRFWAAMRSQTVARTVAGAVRYHEVLGLIPSVQKHQKSATMEHFNGHGEVGQLILAHQTFGKKDSEKGSEENDHAVLQMMDRFKQWPIVLVIDYDRQGSRRQVNHLVENAIVTMFKDIPLKRAVTRYASVMVQLSPTRARPKGHKVSYQDLQVLEVLPRRHPLLAGAGNFKTQGKAGNQLNALRFAGGHYIQMMDANMGASFSEACKVPFILRTFQPSNHTDRRTVRFRILGFREFIFTEHHGMVGSIMASAESSFGTICQRFLAGLDVRMHYGHPDFIDAFWASNRGSLSKASPAINLSEDIFAGFNARMRGERSEHSDALAWEKGRETSFNTSSQFFYKVSTGNVGVMKSRDLKILCERLNISDNLSFYFASIGFYLNNWLIDMSIKIYVYFFVLLTLSSKSLEDVGSVGSMLAAEWIISMGIVATLPRCAELVLEYGTLEGFLKFLPSLPGIMSAFTFINKSIAAGVGTVMVTGEANYIATGRPNANTHFNWRECYFIHSETHYYPSLALIMWYLVYSSLSQQRESAALPMFVILISAALWLTAPIIFCPQPRYARLQVDMREFWKFVVATPKNPVRGMDQNRGLLENQLNTGFRDEKATLYEVWLHRALEHKRRSKTLQGTLLAWNVFILAVLIGLCQVGVYIGLWNFFVAFICHAVLIMFWEACGRPEALMLLAFISVFVLPYIFMPDMLLCDYLLALIILVQCLVVIKQAILLFCRLLLNPRLDWPQMPHREAAAWRARQKVAVRTRRYDVIVEFFFINFMEYELHLLAALMILIVNLVTQLVMVILDRLCGLHSELLLNRNLGVRLGACSRRRKFEPGRPLRTPANSLAGSTTATTSEAPTNAEGGPGPSPGAGGSRGSGGNDDSHPPATDGRQGGNGDSQGSGGGGPAGGRGGSRGPAPASFETTSRQPLLRHSDKPEEFEDQTTQDNIGPPSNSSSLVASTESQARSRVPTPDLAQNRRTVDAPTTPATTAGTTTAATAATTTPTATAAATAAAAAAASATATRTTADNDVGEERATALLAEESQTPGLQVSEESTVKSPSSNFNTEDYHPYSVPPLPVVR